MTLLEAKRVQSFPDGFQVTGSWGEKSHVAQIGNSKSALWQGLFLQKNEPSSELVVGGARLSGNNPVAVKVAMSCSRNVKDHARPGPRFSGGQVAGCMQSAIMELVERRKEPWVRRRYSKHRLQVTPAKRGKGKKPRLLDEDQTPAERQAAITWAKRLKRVFNIDKVN